MIVAAGNPPEYNKSVRDFDVVTLDRVKKIEVEPDYEAFREYAVKARIHPAVVSYLDARPASFYQMETTVDGRCFATPRAGRICPGFWRSTRSWASLWIKRWCASISSTTGSRGNSPPIWNCTGNKHAI